MNVPLGNKGLEKSPATPKRISPKIGRVRGCPCVIANLLYPGTPVAEQLVAAMTVPPMMGNRLRLPFV